MRLVTALLLALAPVPALAYSDLGAIDSIDKAKAYVEKHRGDAAPDGFTLNLAFCDTDECVINQAQTLVAMKGAYKRDYGDQRNLAYCLSRDCEGVSSNPTMGCAWRIVILASGHAEVDDGDISNFKLECGRVEPAQLATAKAKAAELFRKVYKRKISADFQ